MSPKSHISPLSINRPRVPLDRVGWFWPIKAYRIKTKISDSSVSICIQTSGRTNQLFNVRKPRTFFAKIFWKVSNPENSKVSWIPKKFIFSSFAILNFKTGPKLKQSCFSAAKVAKVLTIYSKHFWFNFGPVSEIWGFGFEFTFATFAELSRVVNHVTRPPIITT